jgi:hypothetical protein
MTARAERKPDPDKRKGSPVPGKARKSATPEDSDDQLPEKENEGSYDNPSGETRRVVTNHDEEHRITNSGDNTEAIQEKEQEGV